MNEEIGSGNYKPSVNHKTSSVTKIVAQSIKPKKKNEALAPLKILIRSTIGKAFFFLNRMSKSQLHNVTVLSFPLSWHSL